MSEPDDQLLTRYLLGQLADEETERLDERSIADDGFASRLEAAENDLVDVFVRGELSGDSLEGFKRVYLSSPARQRKVEFARALVQVSRKVGPAGQPATSSTCDEASARRSIWALFTSPQRLQWAFAAAALLFLFAAGYLFRQNRDLRDEATAARQRQAELTAHTQELERQMNEHPAATAASAQPSETTQSTAANALTMAVLLLPQTRGASQLARVSIPDRADQLNLQLQLESDDFPAYRVTLKDLKSGNSLWTSEKLKSSSAANTRIVTLHPPSRLLKSQNYALELSGVGAGGKSEFIGGYVFKAVIE